MNLIAILEAPQKTLSNVYSSKGGTLISVHFSDYVLLGLGKAISYVYPLLRSHANWTLDSDDFRSSTAENSSVQNLLDGN